MTRARWGMGLAMAWVGALAGCGSDGDADPCADVEGSCVALTEGADTDEVLGAFVAVEAGQTIAFGRGTFHLDRELTMNPVAGVTIRGAGMDETILSFADQTMGHGIFVGSGGDDFLIEDLTIQDSRQNGIEVRGTTGIVFRRIKVEWTADPNEIDPGDLDGGEVASPFGRYAIYPTSCRELLIEDSVAKRASDAGVYVGSCFDAVLRGNRAEENVSGLQVENTLRADVYDNVAENNVLGMLVHDLPDRADSNANGDQTRVFNNRFVNNNFINFALPTDLTTDVPTGTGMAVLARANVEIFDNEITGNDTLGVGVISMFLMSGSFSTANGYYPYPTNLHIHGNTFSGNGTSPEFSRRGEPVELGLVLNQMRLNHPDEVVPDVVYDGFLDPDVVAEMPGEDNPMRLCLGDPPDGTFLNMQATPEKMQSASEGDLAPLIEGVSTDDTAFRCTLGAEDGFPLPAVDL
jgi:parallel beta-helix repeat protein